MVLLYLLLLVVLVILCVILLYCVPFLGIALLLYPFAKLGAILFRFLRSKSDAAKNTFLLCSLASWLGVWGLSYLATVSKWLTADQRDTAAVLLALLTLFYPIPLLILLVLLRRNWYTVLLAILSLFFSSKPPASK